MLRPFVVGALAACLAASGCSASQGDFSADSPDPEAEVTYRQGSWILDPNDEVALAEWADEIFIGTVDSLSGSETEEAAFPRTGYDVTVESVIDGEPPDTVHVIQDGGYTEGGEELILFDGDHLLEPGAQHLFVVHVVEGDRLLFPVAGNEELESPAETAAAQAEFTQAVAEAEAGGH